MDLNTIMIKLLSENPGTGIILLGIGLTLIQIAPIKLNPWSWIGSMFYVPIRKFCRYITSDLMDCIDDMKDELKKQSSELENLNTDIAALKVSMGEDKALRRRIRILRFGDEIRSGEKHSLEHFNEILRDISEYHIYCEAHPTFENSKAVATIEIIERDYKDRLANNNFL